MRSNPRLLTAVVSLLVIVVTLLAFAIFGRQTGASGLLPILATPTDSSGLEVGNIEAVTFSELNSDPLSYLNKSIEVSGNFLALERPSCPRYSGPDYRWAMVSEELQLDVLGFERVVKLIRPGTEMTVQGIWRLYQGPLGCGKAPVRDSTWYLQAMKIVEPNPLVGEGSSGAIGIENARPGLPDLLPTATFTLTPVPTPTLAPATPELVPTQDPLLPTLAPNLTATALATPDATTSITPSPTFVGGATSPATTVPGQNTTPLATTTTGAGGGVPSATPQTPVPATSTQTTGGYPGATSTLEGYP